MTMLLVSIYLLPFLLALVFAWRKNLALYLALAALTLFLSWVLYAMYVTMVFGFVLPWVLLWFSAFKMRSSNRANDDQAVH